MKHNRMKYLLFILVFLLPAGFAHADHPPGNRLSVFVSIQPQHYVVERIGGGRVTAEVLVPPGKSPATYAPSPLQMSRLSDADVLFRTGMPFENHLMPKIGQNMRLAIVDLRHGVQLRTMHDHHHDDHNGRGGHDDAEGSDPHIWLNPRLVKIQAETICDTLAKLDPAGRIEYRANLKTLKTDLDRLDEKIRATLAPVRGRAFFVFHPSFGYFADAYGLKQIAVEVEGKAPKGKDLAFLIKKAKNQDVRVIFVQPQFDRNTASKIADAIRGDLVTLDPLAADYIRNLDDMATKILHALR